MRKFCHRKATDATTSGERGKGRVLGTCLCTGGRRVPLVSIFRRTKRRSVPGSRTSRASVKAVPSALRNTSTVFSTNLCGRGLCIRMASKGLAINIGGSMAARSRA